MIEISHVGNSLIARFPGDHGRTHSLDLSELLVVGDYGLKLAHAVARNSENLRYHSIRSRLYGLRSLGTMCRQHGINRSPQNSYDWQDFILDFYEFVLARNDTKSSLKSRFSTWQRVIANTLAELRDIDELIPPGVEIPRPPNALTRPDKLDHRASLVGETGLAAPNEDDDKTLVSISLSRTDADYLEQIRDALSRRNRLLDECLQSWWQQIEAHFQYGENAIKATNWERLQNYIAASIDLGTGRKHVRRIGYSADGSTEEAIGELLTILAFRHGRFCSEAIYDQTPYLPNPQLIRIPGSAPATVSSRVTPMQRINWMLGNLSPIDIAVFVALLSLHAPRFTPEAIMNARVRDRGGRLYLESGDIAESFRVTKYRAKAVKEMPLDGVAGDLIRGVLKVTAARRLALERDGSPFANALLICSNQGTVSVPSPSELSVLISGSNRKRFPNGRCLANYFPQLKEVGLDSNVTFRRIRCTQGVLEWFRTGSVERMAQKLGNSRNVALQHYLPGPLVVAWNTRLLRQFQNLWIAVACANEPFLLQVSDFENLTDLNLFLAQMLQAHAPGSSPLAELLHAYFGPSSADTRHHDHSASLAVSVSDGGLTLLYLYQRAASKSGVTPEVLDREDVATGLRPRQFIRLADLLMAQLPHDRSPEVRRIHEAALERAERESNQVHWETLFLSRERSLNARHSEHP